MSTTHQALRRPAPELTPTLCFNTTYLRDFLRTSRSQLDDTISTSLNALLTPSLTHPFDPTSTSDPSTNRRGARSNGPLSQDTCAQFLQNTIFPTWSSRSQVISYCSIVATSPDPDDPDAERVRDDRVAQSHRVVDERLDPYSGRFFPREPRAEVLGSILRNENAVENIVRERTWRILSERCNGLDPGLRGWQDAMRKWEEGQRRT